jgi:TolA-binding protein
VYANWKSKDLQYYWKHLDIPIVPRNYTWSDKGFEEALSMAREGDEAARLHLNRIIKRDPNSKQAELAKEALKGR